MMESPTVQGKKSLCYLDIEGQYCLSAVCIWPKAVDPYSYPIFARVAPESNQSKSETEHSNCVTGTKKF